MTATRWASPTALGRAWPARRTQRRFLNAIGPVAAAWRDRPPRANRAPMAVGAVPDRRLSPGGRLTLTVDVSQAFSDPDGDALTYGASSSAPGVATVQARGSRVAVTGVARAYRRSR